MTFALLFLPLFTYARVLHTSYLPTFHACRAGLSDHFAYLAEVPSDGRLGAEARSHGSVRGDDEKEDVSTLPYSLID